MAKNFTAQSSRTGMRYRGHACLYALGMIMTLIAVASYAVDVGIIDLAMSKMQAATDAAIRVAGAKISLGESLPAAGGKTLRTDAKDIYLSNFYSANYLNPAQTPYLNEPNITLLDTEIQFIKWNFTNRTWTGPYTGTQIQAQGANGIRIVPSRTTARGNGVTLYFAPIIGRSSLDIGDGNLTSNVAGSRTIEAIAVVDPTAKFSGFIGLSTIDIKNNMQVWSHNYSTSTADTPKGNNNLLGSNGAITAKNNNEFNSIILGPGGSLATGNNTNYNSKIILPNALSYPNMTLPAGHTAVAPPTTGLTAIPSGTYYWTSWPNKDVTFAGIATVYVTGNSTSIGNITAYNLKPGNLNINLVGAIEFSGTNQVDIYASIYGPQASIDIKNTGTIRGSVIVDSITIKNNGTLIYDDSLGGGASGTPFKIMK